MSQVPEPPVPEPPQLREPPHHPPAELPEPPHHQRAELPERLNRSLERNATSPVAPHASSAWALPMAVAAANIQLQPTTRYTQSFESTSSFIPYTQMVNQRRQEPNPAAKNASIVRERQAPRLHVSKHGLLRHIVL